MSQLPAMPAARHIALPDGGWLNVHEQAGSGPTLLLLHGFTDCAESFRLLLPHLAGRHLVIPDLRGHGASFRGRIDTLSTFAEDVEAVAASLGLTRVELAGHSMGAMVSVTLAARGKLDLTALLTISGSLRPGGTDLQALAGDLEALPEPVPSTHPFLDAWYACDGSVPAGFIATLKASFAAMRREDWSACLAILATTDLRAEAGRLAIPSIVINGAKDGIFTSTHHDELITALSPAHYVTLPNAGHNPHWDAPTEVAAVIRDALRAVACDPSMMGSARL